MALRETIHGTIFARASERPSAAFATVLRGSEETTLCYGELAERSLAYAAAYRARGVESGDCVALMLPLSTELFPAFLGAMLMGAIPAFFPTLTHKQDPDLFWHAHDAVFRRMPARLLVVSSDDLRLVHERLPAHRDVAAAVTDLRRNAKAFDVESIVTSVDVAFLQHSSGTTGLKKGVALSHRAVLRQLEAYAAALELSDSDRVVTWLPLYHDMGLVACFLLPAILGLPIVCLDPLEWVVQPWTLLDAIERHACTHAWLPNFAFQHIVRTLRPGTRWQLATMRAFIDCSEPCKPASLEMFREAFCGMGLAREALQVCYAMAENVFAVTQTSPGRCPRVVHADREIFLAEHRIVHATADRHAVDFLSCGRPIATAQVRVAGPDMKPLPQGCVGRILIGGSTLFDGYHRADKTANRPQDGWYASGDLGFLLDGELYVTGRADDVLIINGHNIYAHDVEHALALHTPVKPGRSVALGVFNDETGSQELVLVVEVGQPADRGALRRRIAEVVASEVGVGVTTVAFVEPGWLVKTTSGKIGRGANLEKYLAMRGHDTSTP